MATKFQRASDSVSLDALVVRGGAHDDEKKNGSKVSATTAQEIIALRERLMEAAMAKAGDRRKAMVGAGFGVGPDPATGVGIDIPGIWYLGSQNTTKLYQGNQYQIEVVNASTGVAGQLWLGNPNATGSTDTTVININGTLSVNGTIAGYGDYASTSTTATQYTAIQFATVTNQTGSVTSSGTPVDTIILPVGTYDVSWRANIGAGSPSALQLAIGVTAGVVDGVTGGALGIGTIINRTAAGNVTAAATPTPLQVGSRNILKVTTAAHIQLCPITNTAGQTLAAVNTFTAELVVRSIGI